MGRTGLLVADKYFPYLPPRLGFFPFFKTRFFCQYSWTIVLFDILKQLALLGLLKTLGDKTGWV